MTPRPLSAILARLIWLSLLPLLLVAGGVAVFHVQSEQTATHAAAVRRLGNFGAQIDGFLEARIMALEMLARSPLADDPKRLPDLYAEAQAFQASFGSHVIFADVEQQMLFNTRVPFGTTLPKLPDDHKGRSAAAFALETGRPAVSDIVLGPVINQPLFAIVVPGLRDGKVRHLMLLTTTIGELQGHLDSISLQADWAFSVREGTGELIARKAPTGFDPARDVDDGWRFDVQSRFAPWTFSVDAPRAVVQKPLRNSLAVLLSLIVLATLAGRALGRRATGRVLRQVNALVEPGVAAPAADIVEIAAVRTRLDAHLAELRESEARFEGTFEQAAVGIALVAPDGRWLRVNGKLCSIVDYPQKELLTKTFQDITHPDDLDTDLDQVRRMLAGEIDTYTLEKRYYRKNDGIVWIDLTVSLVRKTDGSPDYFISVVEDISARKAAEQSLVESQAAALAKQYQAQLAALNLMEDAVEARDRAEQASQALLKSKEELSISEKRYRSVIAVSNTGAWEFHRKEKYLWCSPEYFKMLGRNSDNYLMDGNSNLEKIWTDLIHPDDRQSAVDHFANYLDAGSIGMYENVFRMSHNNGSWVWIWSRGQTIRNPDGTVSDYTIGTHIDITERERLHKELAVLNAELELKVEQRTAQLEATNKELEAFSYSVSHDLRAPLRHISGYVDLLSTRFRDALPEKAGHYLNQITDSAQQMGTLIDDLLQFSRSGRQELRQADLEMNTVVQEALEKLKPDTKNRNISWTVAQLPQVYGDYALLQQVWINLLDNAVKYTLHKDQATIEVGFTREPDQWVFFVRDNGVGFDMQYAHKLFGVFQRLHSPAQFEGTGIGLANVQRIIHKHGGRVRAEAQPEKGATFYFTLPEKTFAKGGPS